MAHWHYGHNVAGYSPEAETGTADTFTHARSGLDSDLSFERDGLDYSPEAAEQQALYGSLTEAMSWLALATGPEFLAYTSDGTEHRIPTAWWVTPCGEGDACETWQADQAEQSDMADAAMTARRESSACGL